MTAHPQLASARPSAVRVWLQLFRVPNLFTVPGDPLAGFLLASGGQLDGRAATAVAASFAFYGSGLLFNDLADLEEDRRDRPTRPLPSGAALPAKVWVVASGLATFGLVCGVLLNVPAALCGASLLVLITLYNFYSKKVPIWGALNMGLCRGFSLLFGALAAYSPETRLGQSEIFLRAFWSMPQTVLVAAAVLTFYIASVTNVARFETGTAPSRGHLVLPLATIFVGAITFYFFTSVFGHHDHVSTFALTGVLLFTIYTAWTIDRRLAHAPPGSIPPLIGQMIRLLLLLQAAFCLGAHRITGGLCALALLALWPLSRQVSKRFYAS